MNIAEINNSSEGVLTDIKGRTNLLVSFGGIQAGLGVPLFEFFNSIAEIDCDKVFLRDFNQAWYQMGVDQKAPTPESIISLLQEIISRHSYDRVCFLGNSMGGYAAILFGALLQADQIIAFAPQTYIGRLKRLMTLDRRWRKQIGKIHGFVGKNTNYFDLKKHLKVNAPYHADIHIYYSSEYRLDKLHAERLASCHNITLHAHTEGGHNVVKAIRNRGDLQGIIKNAFKI